MMNFMFGRWTFLLLSVLFGCLFVGDAEEDLSQFLYLQMDPEDYYPIEEFKPKPRRDNEVDRPKFLYDPTYPYPRVVEFYAQ